MSIAVLSDIHGNHTALKTCVDYALEKKVNAFIFLGDYLGELAYPQKTMQFLYKLAAAYPCYFVRGNKEDYWIAYEKSGATGWKEIDSTTGALYYTYHQLTKKDRDFFRELPISQTINPGNNPEMPPLTICHGSPYKTNEKMLPNQERTFEILRDSDTLLILCGHAHIQGKIEKDGKRVLNPGAVGVPMESGGKTQFLILQEIEGNWQEEFVSLDYDIDKVVKELQTSGLKQYAPSWCRITENLLRKGSPSHGAVLSRAMELCRLETGDCIWPEIPEKYYEIAIAEMIDGNAKITKEYCHRQESRIH